MSIARNGTSGALNRSNGNDGAFARVTSKENNATLATEESAQIHQAVIDSIAEELNNKASQDVGIWQRRMERQSFGHIPDIEEAPQELKEASAKAKAFPTATLDEQIAIAGPELAPFMDGVQKFGNDRVAVDEDFTYYKKDTLLGLKTQALVQAVIPGKIQLTALDGGDAEFLIEDQGVFMTANLSNRVIIFGLSDEEIDMNNLEEGRAKAEWVHRSWDMTITDYLHDGGQELRKQYDDCHKTAMLHHLMATSDLRGMHETLSDLDQESRTVTISEDDTEYTLRAKGEKPELLTSSGDVIHPAMVPGFMDHIAKKNGLADGDALYSGLQNIFVTAERNLVR